MTINRHRANVSNIYCQDGRFKSIYKNLPKRETIILEEYYNKLEAWLGEGYYNKNREVLI